MARLAETVAGSIIVLDSGIYVTEFDRSGETSTKYDRVCMENLADAARVLGLWLELPKEE